MPAVQETIDQVKAIDVDQYKYGFVTDIESEKGAKGLSEETIRFLSAKKFSFKRFYFRGNQWLKPIVVRK